MTRVVIIGGGFAGLSALRRLSGYSSRLDLTLLDHRGTFDFLPLLPDLIGRPMSPGALQYDLATFCRRKNCRFIPQPAISVDSVTGVVRTPTQEIQADYVIVACGTVTDFHDIVTADQVLKLDCVQDAVAIKRDVISGSYESLVVMGGGYTGVETASNLRRLFDCNEISRRIILVERSDRVLKALPEECSDFAAENLARMGVEVIINANLKTLRGDCLELTNGLSLPRSRVIMTTGVKTPACVQNMPAEKLRHGRLVVDPFLRVGARCFAAGDAAGFEVDGKPIRMGVQASLREGSCAAANIIRCIEGKPLRNFKPFDPGYIVPMGNGRSCGAIFGKVLTGFLPTLLHYGLCLFYSESWANRFKVLSGALVRK